MKRWNKLCLLCAFFWREEEMCAKQIESSVFFRKILSGNSFIFLFIYRNSFYHQKKNRIIYFLHEKNIEYVTPSSVLFHKFLQWRILTLFKIFVFLLNTNFQFPFLPPVYSSIFFVSKKSLDQKMQLLLTERMKTSQQIYNKKKICY